MNLTAPLTRPLTGRLTQGIAALQGASGPTIPPTSLMLNGQPIKLNAQPITKAA